MNKIRVMFFVYIFGGGGAEKMILNILNNIDNSKYELILLLGTKEGNEYLEMLENDKVYIDYINVPLGSHDVAIRKIADKINEYNPDILFTEARYTNWLSYHAKRVSKNKNVKLIFREATVRSMVENPKFKDKLKTFLHYNFGASHIIAISKGIKKDLNKVYKVLNKKITYIYNPIELEKVIEKSNEKIDNNIFKNIKGKKIINVGRFVPQKNQLLLLKSFEVLLKRMDDVSLVFLGRGPLKTELENYCMENKLKKVYFIDFDVNPYKYIKKVTYLYYLQK